MKKITHPKLESAQLLTKPKHIYQPQNDGISRVARNPGPGGPGKPERGIHGNIECSTSVIKYVQHKQAQFQCPEAQFNPETYPKGYRKQAKTPFTPTLFNSLECDF